MRFSRKFVTTTECATSSILPGARPAVRQGPGAVGLWPQPLRNARTGSAASSKDRVSSATCAAISRKRRAELVMTEHKFKIGQLVYFQPGSPDHARPGPYQIVRRLPESEGEFHYVIRSTYEDHERVARESQLTRA